MFVLAVCMISRAPLAWTGEADDPIAISGRAWRRDNGLDVDVKLRNACRTALGPLSVEAELFGQVRRGRIKEGLAPGRENALRFRYSRAPSRPGIYPLVLLFEHAHGAVRISRRGCLLLSLGKNADPAFRVFVDDMDMQWQAQTTVRLTSLDGRPHRAALRALSGRGLRVVDAERLVNVPAEESARVVFRVLFAGAPRSARQGLLVLASAKDGDVERTSVASSVVRLKDERPWLPWLRWPLAVIGFVLLAFVVVIELGLVGGGAC